MRAIALTFIISIVPLMADFYPRTVASSVVNVKQNSVTLSRAFPAKGMSGAIIHDYGKNLTGITTYLVYEGDRRAKLVNNDPITHEELPTIKPKVRPNDKVIGGYLYQNILVLAPDANTYARIVSSANKNWIHPDLFAMFLSQEGDQLPNRINLKKFANEYQVGLIYIVQKGKAVLYDPISQRYVSQKKLTGLPKKGEFPFYMRLGKIEAGWFSSEASGSYYQTMESIR